jgi:hypothetical protein
LELIFFARIKALLCRRRSSHMTSRPFTLAWAGRASDQRQDFRKHLPRHRDLGQLEADVAAVADDLGADLDQLLARAGQRPGSAALGIVSARMKLPRL